MMSLLEGKVIRTPLKDKAGIGVALRVEERNVTGDCLLFERSLEIPFFSY